MKCCVSKSRSSSFEADSPLLKASHRDRTVRCRPKPAARSMPLECLLSTHSGHNSTMARLPFVPRPFQWVGVHQTDSHPARLRPAPARHRGCLLLRPQSRAALSRGHREVQPGGLADHAGKRRRALPLFNLRIVSAADWADGALVYLGNS